MLILVKITHRHIHTHIYTYTLLSYPFDPPRVALYDDRLQQRPELLTVGGQDLLRYERIRTCIYIQYSLYTISIQAGISTVDIYNI